MPLRLSSWLSCSIALQHIFMKQTPAAMKFGMYTHKDGNVSPIFLLLLTRWQSVMTEENIASGNAHSSSCSYSLKAIIDLISRIYNSLAQILPSNFAVCYSFCKHITGVNTATSFLSTTSFLSVVVMSTAKFLLMLSSSTG